MLRVLIVDRDRDTAEALARVFGAEGWQTDAVPGPGEALEVLEQNGAFDVVLLEVSLPVGTELDFVREKRRRPAIAAIPVVAMTADVGIPGTLEGVARVLRKPFAIGFAMAAICHAAAYGPRRSGGTLPAEAPRRA